MLTSNVFFLKKTEKRWKNYMTSLSHSVSNYPAYQQMVEVETTQISEEELRIKSFNYSCAYYSAYACWALSCPFRCPCICIGLLNHPVEGSSNIDEQYNNLENIYFYPLNVTERDFRVNQMLIQNYDLLKQKLTAREYIKDILGDKFLSDIVFEYSMPTSLNNKDLNEFNSLVKIYFVFKKYHLKWPRELSFMKKSLSNYQSNWVEDPITLNFEFNRNTDRPRIREIAGPQERYISGY